MSSPATGFFKRGIAEAFRGNVDVDTDTFYWQALTSGYVPDFAAHDYLDDVDVAYRVGSPVAVTLTMSDDAELGSDSPEVTDPADGDELSRGVIYKSGASDAARLLILCYGAFREAPKTSTGAAATFNLPAVLARFGD
jgi:hypothetical protein